MQQEDATDGIRIVPDRIVTRNENTTTTTTTTTTLEIDIRSQRLSDTYPIRQVIQARTQTLPIRLYRKFVSLYLLDPIICFLFPRVLNHTALASILLFRPTTQVKLLCEWTCEEGHICKHPQGHHDGLQPHTCVFGHVVGKPIVKCGHVCDAKMCDADCVLLPGHAGTHACHFNHAWTDIPANRDAQMAFKDDKYMGDYIDELAFISPEDMKYSHIPETLEPTDEQFFEDE